LEYIVIGLYGLALSIDMDNNALDLALALSVGQFFRLSEEQMHEIVLEVLKVVGDWEDLANEIGISKKEQQIMIKAFHI
jgi:serine/threonine-protein kinase HipA